MFHLIFTGALWLVAASSLAALPVTVADDLRFGSDAREADAHVTGHLLGPSVATRPGRNWTSLALSFPLPDGATHGAILHGVLEPPALGAAVRVLYLPSDPDALRLAADAGYAASLEALAAVLGFGALAVAATRGRRPEAALPLRHGPGVVAGGALVLLGLVSASTLAFDAHTVAIRYAEAPATVVDVARCGQVSAGRVGHLPLWCPSLRYEVDGRSYTTEGMSRLVKPAIGASVTVRVHPDRPDFALSEDAGDLATLLVGAAIIAGLGLGLLAVYGGRWRREARARSPA